MANSTCTINLLNFWWCAYTSPWVTQSDASIRHAAWVPRRVPTLKGLQRPSEFALTSEFNQQHFSKQQYWPSLVHWASYVQCLDSVLTTTTTTQGPQNVGWCLSCDLFHVFSILGTLPKWTTIIVSCLHGDRYGWCNSLYKYEVKISASVRTADPLSCVLDYEVKYDDSSLTDLTD